VNREDRPGRERLLLRELGERAVVGRTAARAELEVLEIGEDLGRQRPAGLCLRKRVGLRGLRVHLCLRRQRRRAGAEGRVLEAGGLGRERRRRDAGRARGHWVGRGRDGWERPDGGRGDGVLGPRGGRGSTYKCDAAGGVCYGNGGIACCSGYGCQRGRDDMSACRADRGRGQIVRGRRAGHCIGRRVIMPPRRTVCRTWRRGAHARARTKARAHKLVARICGRWAHQRARERRGRT
jgi:hypothetical protein